MKRDILVIHVLKHHVYNSIYGISKLKDNINLKAFLGMYNNNKFIQFIVKFLNKENQLKGYYNEKIDNFVRTDFFCQVLFLLSKKNKKIDKLYVRYYQKKSKKYIKNSEIIHTIQDYCNDSIRYAKKLGKIVVYEQIIAFDTTIKKYLEEEVEKWNFDCEYIDRNYDANKIEKAKENLKCVDYILSPSRFVTESIITEFGDDIESKIVEFPYGVDINRFKYNKKTYSNNKLELLCVSRVTLSKGTKYLVEAMKSIKDLDIHLTFIGMPCDKEDIKIVNEMKALKNVTYIPNVPHIKINTYFEKSDVFILPSLIEGSALSIYEALASGLPCIVTRNTGSVVRDKIDGFIINEQSIDEIIEKIIYCKNNPDVLSEFSIRARENANRHTWEKYSHNIEMFYKKVLKN